MADAALKTAAPVNGIDVDALMAEIETIKRDPASGIVGFRVTSRWQGGTRSEAAVESYTIGGKTVPRRFTVAADEPLELLGTNTAPNPQEL
ncbi:MAG: OsmC family protein, partial [Rhodospirillaceae bacterium]